MSGWQIRDKTVLITGGNAGVGLETALSLARLGARVYITARSEEVAERTVRRLRSETGSEAGYFVLDLASFESIERATGQVLERLSALHVLINNAGAVHSERAETREGFEMTLGVNHVGHFLFTKLVLERLLASGPARIINVASEAHRRVPGGLDFDDLQSRRRYSGWVAYCRSKLANIYFTQALARRLSGTGVSVNALHPGFVATRFGKDGDTRGIIRLGIRLGRPFALTPEEGAKTSVYCAVEPGLERVTGSYFAKSALKEPSARAKDRVAADRLWSLSEQWVRERRP